MPVESVESVESVENVENVDSYTAKFPQGYSERGKGVEKVWRAPTPQSALSTFSTGISIAPDLPTFSTDGVALEDGVEQWRVWNDQSNTVVATFPTEAEALADATQRVHEALHAA